MRMILVIATALLAIGSSAQSRFEDPADFPLMGDWVGALDRPDSKPEYNRLAAQLVCLDETRYQLRVVAELNRRANPYFDVEVEVKDGRIVYEADGWKFMFEEGICRGERLIGGTPVRLVLKKVAESPPTLGQKPPKGAIVLFDGSGFDEWVHDDRKRAVTWKLFDGQVMEIVSDKWNNMENRKNGIGGSIVTRGTFKSMKLHMEFRVPVEAGKAGQKRGNSGVFISGFKEIQILNSHGMPGYWNDCGALYRHMPPRVNMAAPPLHWQTYDIEVELPERGKTTGFMTVQHNGVTIHNRIAMEMGRRDKVGIRLQDHNNAIQFRNIWVVER